MHQVGRTVSRFVISELCPAERMQSSVQKPIHPENHSSRTTACMLYHLLLNLLQDGAKLHNFSKTSTTCNLELFLKYMTNILYYMTDICYHLAWYYFIQIPFLSMIHIFTFKQLSLSFINIIK